MFRTVVAFAVLAISAVGASKTVVTIQGDRFLINGQPTYKGRTWQGHKIEGLLMNSRMVQGVYDDCQSGDCQTMGIQRYGQVGR